MNQVAQEINEVLASAKQLSAGTQQIVLSMDEISKVTETTASGTQSVSAATEQSLASMQEIQFPQVISLRWPRNYRINYRINYTI